MAPNRREFLSIVAGSVTASLFATTPLARARDRSRIKGVLFDAFPVFDPRPVIALAERFFPGKGADLSNIWRTRQFEYAWLRTVGQHYEDFWQITADALTFAARTLKLDLAAQQRDDLMNAYLELKAYPDVLPALESLNRAGVRLAFLSNLTPKMLAAGIRNSGLDGLFEHVLSTDQVRIYKPDPRAYALGLEALRLTRDEIVFAPFAGWDATGAKWFGYRTFWVNRLHQPVEELGAAPDATGETLSDLLAFVQP